MLVARDKNGKLINLLTEIPMKADFFCPVCQSAVRLKNGNVMRPHFAHITLQTCYFNSENESNEHLSLKAELFASLSKTEKVVVEEAMPELGQIADLLVNESLVLEVQCSRLSEKRLRERTISYRQHDFQVLWLLGEKLWLGKRLSNLHKQLLYFSKNMGFHIWELDAKKREVRLKYLIYEDIFGNIYHQTKTCSFDGDLMAFFRLPYAKQATTYYKVEQRRQVGLFIQKQLMARNPRWLRQQELAYSQGRNLIAQTDTEFFPQVRPPEAKGGFCQIQNDLTLFREAFFQYYQNQENKTVQNLYPPDFYVKMVKNL